MWTYGASAFAMDMASATLTPARVWLLLCGVLLQTASLHAVTVLHPDGPKFMPSPAFRKGVNHSQAHTRAHWPARLTSVSASVQDPLDGQPFQAPFVVFPENICTIDELRRAEARAGAHVAGHVVLLGPRRCGIDRKVAVLQQVGALGGIRPETTVVPGLAAIAVYHPLGAEEPLNVPFVLVADADADALTERWQRTRNVTVLFDRSKNLWWQVATNLAVRAVNTLVALAALGVILLAAATLVQYWRAARLRPLEIGRAHV